MEGYYFYKIGRHKSRVDCLLTTGYLLLEVYFGRYVDITLFDWKVTQLFTEQITSYIREYCCSLRFIFCFVLKLSENNNDIL